MILLVTKNYSFQLPCFSRDYHP